MIIKYVRNQQKKGNKVSGRYSYITHREKASWIYENTLERFDFAIKKRFKDKQDTTHYVVSFDRKLTEEEKKKARQLISDFFFKKFGTEYFLSIAEHEDKEYTHYHILISRHLETAKMLNSVLKAKEYKQLQRELRQLIENAGLLNEREKELNQKYLNSTEVKRSLTAYQHKLYQELKEKIKNGEYVELTKKNAKSFAKAFAEVLASHIKNGGKADKLLKAYDLQLKIEVSKRRKRFYLYSDSMRVRIDKLGDEDKQLLIEYLEQPGQEKQEKQKKVVITDDRERAVEYIKLIGYEGEIEFIQLSDLYELRFFKQDEYKQLLNTVKQALSKDYIVFIEDETKKLQFKNFVLKDLNREDELIRDSSDVEFVREERAREKAREKARERNPKMSKWRGRRNNDNDWGMFR